MDKIKLIETAGEHTIFTGGGILKSVIINKRIEDGGINVVIDGVGHEIEVFEPLKEFTQIDYKETQVLSSLSIHVDTGSSVGVSVIYRN